MISAFKENKDIHSLTAAKVFKVDLDKVTPDMRRRAKEVNFGIIYGISAFGLSQNLNIPRSEAKEIIDSYFEEFKSIKEYMDNSIEKARKNKYVETIFGRRRYLRDIDSRNFTLRGFAERNAINSPIQGSAADIIKLAMIKVLKWINDNQLKSKMIMQVHDELVFEAPIKKLDFVKSKVSNAMESAVKLSIPLLVDIGFGNNWNESH
jgi:DNA polymerase-1